jgi:hypothetical protein
MTKIDELRVPEKAPPRLTGILLMAGVIAGIPSGVISWTLALTRDGFDVTKHANSQLALGPWGWIQTTNFVVFGLLLLALAVGTWRALAGRPGGRVAAVGIGLYGFTAGIVVALNPTDPMFGFPPGSPDGYAGYAQLSASAKTHGMAASIGFLAVTVACFALARYFASSREWLWMWFSLAVGAALVGASVYMSMNANAPTEHFQYLPIWLIGSVGWIYISVVSWKMLQHSRFDQRATR